jgi:DNA polymerase-3 subunit delta
VKANKAQLERALKSPPAEIRFFLLYGPDEAGSRALMKMLGPAGAERIELSGAELKSDPARLTDEAAAISLFGDPRVIVVEPAGDEVLAAVEGLIEAPAAGNSVAIVAGALKPTSKLLKLALTAPCAMAFASYVPDARDAPKLVMELAREHGLTVRPDLARRIADSAAGNRAVIAQELSKFALFLDAAPERPKQVEADTVEAIGAASEEGDRSRLVAAVAGGDVKTLQSELLRLRSEGVEGIALIRPMLGRMALLAKLRGEVERGNSVDTVMATHGKTIFWKEKDVVAAQLSRWSSDLVAKAMSRLLDAERQVKASGGLGPLAVDEELFAICRQAARLR